MPGWIELPSWNLPVPSWLYFQWQYVLAIHYVKYANLQRPHDECGNEWRSGEELWPAVLLSGLSMPVEPELHEQ